MAMSNGGSSPKKASLNRRASEEPFQTLLESEHARARYTDRTSNKVFEYEAKRSVYGSDPSFFEERESYSPQRRTASPDQESEPPTEILENGTWRKVSSDPKSAQKWRNSDVGGKEEPDETSRRPTPDDYRKDLSYYVGENRKKSQSRPPWTESSPMYGESRDTSPDNAHDPCSDLTRDEIDSHRRKQTQCNGYSTPDEYPSRRSSTRDEIIPDDCHRRNQTRYSNSKSDDYQSRRSSVRDEISPDDNYRHNQRRSNDSIPDGHQPRRSSVRDETSPNDCYSRNSTRSNAATYRSSTREEIDPDEYSTRKHTRCDAAISNDDSRRSTNISRASKNTEDMRRGNCSPDASRSKSPEHCDSPRELSGDEYRKDWRQQKSAAMGTRVGGSGPREAVGTSKQQSDPCRRSSDGDPRGGLPEACRAPHDDESDATEVWTNDGWKKLRDARSTQELAGSKRSVREQPQRFDEMDMGSNHDGRRASNDNEEQRRKSSSKSDNSRRASNPDYGDREIVMPGRFDERDMRSNNDGRRPSNANDEEKRRKSSSKSETGRRAPSPNYSEASYKTPSEMSTEIFVAERQWRQVTDDDRARIRREAQEGKARRSHEGTTVKSEAGESEIWDGSIAARRLSSKSIKPMPSIPDEADYGAPKDACETRQSKLRNGDAPAGCGDARGGGGDFEQSAARHGNRKGTLMRYSIAGDRDGYNGLTRLQDGPLMKVELNLHDPDELEVARGIVWAFDSEGAYIKRFKPEIEGKIPTGTQGSGMICEVKVGDRLKKINTTIVDSLGQQDIMQLWCDAQETNDFLLTLEFLMV